ncbi:MAG TPA: hypothetical protein VF077_06205 [Nitrospiraceae bacterium]
MSDWTLVDVYKWVLICGGVWAVVIVFRWLRLELAELKHYRERERNELRRSAERAEARR